MTHADSAEGTTPPLTVIQTAGFVSQRNHQKSGAQFDKGLDILQVLVRSQAMNYSSRRSLLLLSSIAAGKPKNGLAQAQSAPELALAKAMNQMRPWVADGASSVLAGALQQQLRGQHRSIDLKNAAQALRLYAMHAQESGVFEPSERLFRASHRQLRLITANGLSRELSQTLQRQGLPVPPREIARLADALERGRDEAIALMMAHDRPHLRAFGNAVRSLDRRARLLANRPAGGQVTILPAYQQQDPDIYEGMPTFSTTVCGNCESMVWATMALTGAAWAMAGPVCPPCGVGGRPLPSYLRSSTC